MFLDRAIDAFADHLEADAIEAEEAGRARDPEIAAAVLGQGDDRPRRIASLAPALVREMGERARRFACRDRDGEGTNMAATRSALISCTPVRNVRLSYDLINASRSPLI